MDNSIYSSEHGDIRAYEDDEIFIVYRAGRFLACLQKTNVVMDYFSESYMDIGDIEQIEAMAENWAELYYEEKEA